jgi:hypothetical protein
MAADVVTGNTGEVIGGSGALALQCLDGAGFADAMRRKFVRATPKA